MVLVILHVSIALTSLAVAALSALSPSRTRLQATYGLIAGTLATGTVLVMSTHSSLTGACLSGLAYLVIAGSLTGLARLRLAAGPTNQA